MSARSEICKVAEYTIALDQVQLVIDSREGQQLDSRGLHMYNVVIVHIAGAVIRLWNDQYSTSKYADQFMKEYDEWLNYVEGR